MGGSMSNFLTGLRRNCCPTRKRLPRSSSYTDARMNPLVESQLCSTLSKSLTLTSPGQKSSAPSVAQPTTKSTTRARYRSLRGETPSTLTGWEDISK